MITATRTFILLIGCLLASTPALSQSKTGTTIGNFLMIEPSAQVAAMGNAGATALDGAMAAYYNPGALGRLPQSSAQFTHSPWLADIQYNYASIAVKMGPNALLLSVTALGLRRHGRSHGGPAAAARASSSRSNDLALGLGYGRQITDRFSAGMQVKYIQETIWHSSLSAVGLDVGVIYELPFRAFLGASISNFGSPRQLRRARPPHPLRPGHRHASGTTATSRPRSKRRSTRSPSSSASASACRCRSAPTAA